MRISTSYAQTQAIEDLNQRQVKVAEAQAQIGSGQRVNRPSDDPMAAAEAERLRSKQARIESEKRAVAYVKEMLAGAETALGDAINLLQLGREQLLSAGNATASREDRLAQAMGLRQVREQLLTVANRGDPRGGYVFGGQGTVEAPVDAAGTGYGPHAGSVMVGHQLVQPVSFDGRENFTAIATPSGPESIFSQIDAVIATLENPLVSNPNAQAFARDALAGVDRAMERIGLTRTMVGERLRGIDAHEQALEGGSIEAQTRLSNLVDLDLGQAISGLVRQQTTLEAAMKSYAQIARLSLFEYV
jgi:flagellar hook-associated protein 3 FlgL